ncbi:MAG TPA: hypothetical protein VKH45_01440 [Candidatus Acidoferrum sp.]|nr:hypothetical protein [Candidatus Acidoferrum sp.]
MLGRAYFASGRYEEAARLAESSMEILSNDYNALIPLINSFERLGRKTDAERLRRREVQVLQDQLQHFPDDVRARVLLAAYLVAAGDKDGSVMQVKIAVAMRPTDANILYNAACTYGLLGMKSEALGSFRSAVAAGYSNTDWSTHDPDLKILHDDPEFRAMTTAKTPKAT